MTENDDVHVPDHEWDGCELTCCEQAIIVTGSCLLLVVLPTAVVLATVGLLATWFVRTLLGSW